MGHQIKYIAQLCDSNTDEILAQEEIKVKNIQFPKTFQEFGLRHKEQIDLIKKSQDFFLTYQCNSFVELSTCPQCKKKTSKNGKHKSDFHDIFTDHKVFIQAMGCTCGWSSQRTVKGIYGNASHPELEKIQTKSCAEVSFDKARDYLNDICCGERKVNNHATLIANVRKVGVFLEELKFSETWNNSNEAASQIILNVDGGHVQDRTQGRHSFEELISTAYKPEDLVNVSDKRKEILRKISVASAKSDKQKTIKELTKNACLKLGMTEKTNVTALTDGASNCWPVAEYIIPLCNKVTKVLDWFHVGMKFKERQSKIPNELIDEYNGAKWYLWHGKPKDAIFRLKKLKYKLTDKDAVEKIKELLIYIDNNIGNIVNYEDREKNNLPFTSQLAETSVNTIINQRQKNKKMQWTREGAHNILQIRTSIFSKNFDEDWDNIQEKMYKNAA